MRRIDRSQSTRLKRYVIGKECEIAHVAPTDDRGGRWDRVSGFWPTGAAMCWRIGYSADVGVAAALAPHVDYGGFSCWRCRGAFCPMMAPVCGRSGSRNNFFSFIARKVGVSNVRIDLLHYNFSHDSRSGADSAMRTRRCAAHGSRSAALSLMDTNRTSRSATHAGPLP